MSKSQLEWPAWVSPKSLRYTNPQATNPYTWEEKIRVVILISAISIIVCTVTIQVGSNFLSIEFQIIRMELLVTAFHIIHGSICTWLNN
jgi:hypothetical protein